MTTSPAPPEPSPVVQLAAAVEAWTEYADASRDLRGALIRTHDVRALLAAAALLRSITSAVEHVGHDGAHAALVIDAGRDYLREQVMP